MRPSVGASNPAIIRRHVVLPEPDGPSIEKNSPSRTSRSTPSTAVTVPNRLTMPSMRTATPSPAVEGVPGAASATVVCGSSVMGAQSDGAPRGLQTRSALPQPGGDPPRDGGSLVDQPGVDLHGRGPGVEAGAR